MECNCNNRNNELRIVRGNAFGVRLTVNAVHIDGTPVENFVLGDAEPVLKVIYVGEKTSMDFIIVNNDAVISFDGSLSLGWYGFEMTGIFGGKPWRWCVPKVFQIVETNERANIPAWTILTDDTYTMEGVMTITSGDIYQSDWDETDEKSPSYIKNKPDVVLRPEFNQTVRNLQQDINAEEHARQEADNVLQQNINTEENRANDVEQGLNSRLATAEGDIDTIEGKIPATASSQNKLVDKQQMDNATANFITRSVNDLVNYYLKSETYTRAEVQQLIAAVKQFTYEVVSELPTASASTMNKIYLVPSTNPETKNVKDEYITIATETEEGGETVTTYSWEQIGSTTVDLSGYYTSQQTDTAISNALTTALADYSTTSQMNTAITNALNTALADYSTTTEMTAAIATAIANYYTKSEVDALIANFITKSVNDLVNYYLKSDTYTKAEVQQLIAAVKQFTYEAVSTLPTASASTMNKIYLVPSSDPGTLNVKDEYITIATETEENNETVTTYSWELIGSTQIDLSNYYTKSQTDSAISNALTTALADYSTTSQMNTAITNALNAALADYSTTTEMTAAIATAIANYYTKSEVDALIANFITKSVNDLVNYYLKSDTYTKAEVQQLIAAVKQFTYEVVNELPTASASTMNKIYLVPSSDPGTLNVKDEYITIATETEENNETVTTYSWELIGSTQIDLSNYYTKSQTDSAISSALSTALADYSTTSEMNTAITNALNAALADYSTTTEMTAAIATAIANYYTKSEVDALIANFITKSVNDLVNYYLKSDTYTKTEVQQLIAAVKQFTYEVVSTLPTASDSTMNKIYLVPSADPQTQNVKDEYITIATETEENNETVTTYSWELIGSTQIDLSNYYTKSQTDSAISSALSTALADYSTTSAMNTAITNALNTALADYSTTTEMTAAIATAIANYYTKSEVDSLIANFITKSVNDLVNYYLKSDTYTKTEVQQLIAAVKQFTYEVVSTLPTASASTMNKIYLVPSSDPGTLNVKDEYITIATETEENNETVTTYSWELIGSTQIDLSNYYTKSQTDSAISSALSTALADYSTTSAMNTAITNALNAALADYSTTTEMTAAIATAIANYYTKSEVDNIANTKTDKLPMTGAGAATENNFMAIDANGNIKDSGKNASDFLTQHQSIKTINSASIVGSGNVDLQVPITDNAIIGNGSAVCSTAAGTAQKEVTITDFLLIKNGVVSVKFANAITVASPTLKINDIAAKAIYLNGAAVQPGWILAGVTVNMRYNGAQFDIISMMGPEKTDDELLVDMGLPSGLLWATRNIDVTQANGFAKNIYQYECSLFSWGNTDGRNPTAINSFAPYSWGNANTSEPYASSPGAALTASFGLSFDAAFANLGNQWRMPTTEEFAELFANIDYINPDGTVIETTQANKLVTVNGVVGILLKSKNNSRTLFFPCSGYGNGQSWISRGSNGLYWSSSLYSATYGRLLLFNSGGVYPQYNYGRFYGFSVRPVQNLLSSAQ